MVCFWTVFDGSQRLYLSGKPHLDGLFSGNGRNYLSILVSGVWSCPSAPTRGATKRLFLQSQTPFGVLHSRGQALGTWPCPPVPLPLCGLFEPDHRTSGPRALSLRKLVF
ncbi:hypothetical protein PAPYR_9711 [Paratrimastix pyriformis]|uniref:Uncharacterized protein n=1 Tax=Paratrimastix pyriformis TaxID=342808 RepID=A0ABQ8UBF2_9EUKA|nr:hypothetical protein PAPYR_9711 [Paratrimastix pyriformis]